MSFRPGRSRRSPWQRDQLWPDRQIVWEASDPYLYLRTTADNRIIAGGEDEPFADEDARDRLIDAKSKIILRKLRMLLPGRQLASLPIDGQAISPKRMTACRSSPNPTA